MQVIELKRNFQTVLEQRLQEDLNFIQVVCGPRQVGKTTAVLRISEQWPGPVTYASADLPASPGRQWIRELWNTARAKGSNGLLIIDEVHKVESWSDEVKFLFDQERRRADKIKLVLLSSASWLVQQHLVESLAGRFEIIRAHHWSFFESKKLFNWDLSTYLKFGGYPAPAQFINDKDRWQTFIRDSIIEPMLSRDLLTLRNIAKPALFRRTFNLILRYPAQELSLQKILGQLQDRGNSTTIRSYLELLENGFVLKLLEKYSTRALTKKASSPKLLQLCPALMHAFEEPDKFDLDPDWRGRIFEAAVGAELLRNFPKLSYWRDGANEVDYVIEHEGSLIAIEIKSGRIRNTNGLRAFAKNFKSVKPLIINWEIGEAILASESPKKLLLSLL